MAKPEPRPIFVCWCGKEHAPTVPIVRCSCSEVWHLIGEVWKPPLEFAALPRPWMEPVKIRRLPWPMQHKPDPPAPGCREQLAWYFVRRQLTRDREFYFLEEAGTRRLLAGSLDWDGILRVVGALPWPERRELPRAPNKAERAVQATEKATAARAAAREAQERARVERTPEAFAQANKLADAAQAASARARVAVARATPVGAPLQRNLFGDET